MNISYTDTLEFFLLRKLFTERLYFLQFSVMTHLIPYVLGVMNVVVLRLYIFKHSFVLCITF